MNFILLILLLISSSPVLSATVEMGLLTDLEYSDTFFSKPEALHQNHISTLTISEEKVTYLYEQAKQGDITASKLLASELKMVGRLKEASDALVIYCMHTWMSGKVRDEAFVTQFYRDAPRESLIGFLGQSVKYRQFLRDTFIKNTENIFWNEAFDWFVKFLKPFCDTIPEELNVFSLNELGCLAFRVMRFSLLSPLFSQIKPANRANFLDNFNIFTQELNKRADFNELYMYASSILDNDKDLACDMHSYSQSKNHGFIYEKGHRRSASPLETQRYVWELGNKPNSPCQNFTLGYLTHYGYFNGTFTPNGDLVFFSSEKERNDFTAQKLSLIERDTTKSLLVSGPYGVNSVYIILGKFYETGNITNIYHLGKIKVQNAKHPQFLEEAKRLYLSSLPASSPYLARLLYNNPSINSIDLPYIGKIVLKNDQDKAKVSGKYLVQLTPEVPSEYRDLINIYYLAQNTLGQLYACGRLEEVYNQRGEIVGKIKEQKKKFARALEYFSRVPPTACAVYYDALVRTAQIYQRLGCLDIYQDGEKIGEITSQEQLHDRISFLLAQIPNDDTNYQEAQTFIIGMLYDGQIDYLPTFNKDTTSRTLVKHPLENSLREAYNLASRINTSMALYYRGALILQGYGEFESQDEREKQAIAALENSKTNQAGLFYLANFYLEKAKSCGDLFLAFRHLKNAKILTRNKVKRKENFEKVEFLLEEIEKQLEVIESKIDGIDLQKTEKEQSTEIASTAESSKEGKPEEASKDIDVPEKAPDEQLAAAPQLDTTASEFVLPPSQEAILPEAFKPLNLDMAFVAQRKVEVRKPVIKFLSRDGYRFAPRSEQLFQQFETTPDLRLLTDRKVAGASHLFEIRLNRAYRMIIGLRTDSETVNVLYMGDHDSWQRELDNWRREGF